MLARSAQASTGQMNALCYTEISPIHSVATMPRQVPPSEELDRTGGARRCATYWKTVGRVMARVDIFTLTDRGLGRRQQMITAGMVSVSVNGGRRLFGPGLFVAFGDGARGSSVRQRGGTAYISRKPYPRWKPPRRGLWEAEVHRLAGEIARRADYWKGGTMQFGRALTVARGFSGRSPGSFARRRASRGCSAIRGGASRPMTCSRPSMAGSPKASTHAT